MKSEEIKKQPGKALPESGMRTLSEAEINIIANHISDLWDCLSPAQKVKPGLLSGLEKAFLALGIPTVILFVVLLAISV